MKYSAIAKKNIQDQAKALNTLSSEVPKDFDLLVEYILQLKGRVILIGMGKSGYIAKKIAASLASTGTPSFYIHPGEASHGDLGMITQHDMVIMLSNSGETKELFDTLNYCKRFNIKIAAITMRNDSTLAENSDYLLKLPKQQETSSISAPTTSALMTLSLGDALVTSLHDARGFSKCDFKIFHPGGKIGADLLKVSNIMHKKEEGMPIVSKQDSFADVIMAITKNCLGCAIVMENDNSLAGIITDGDLRRHISQNFDDIKAEDIMSVNPMSISSDILVTEALYAMNSKSITVMPVIDNSQFKGVIHIHDIIKAGAG